MVKTKTYSVANKRRACNMVTTRSATSRANASIQKKKKKVKI